MCYLSSKWQLWEHFWIRESRKGIMALWNGRVAFSMMLLIGLQATPFSGGSITDCSRLDSQRSLDIDQVSASSHSIISRLLNIVGTEILTAVTMSSIKFWNVTPCSPIQAHWRFDRTYCPYLQGRRQSRKQDSLFFDSEVRGSRFFRNVSGLLPDCAALHPRRE
jgi:hypothetical protein